MQAADERIDVTPRVGRGTAAWPEYRVRTRGGKWPNGTAPANRDVNTVSRLSGRNLPLDFGPYAPFPPVRTRYRAIFQSPDMGHPTQLWLR